MSQILPCIYCGTVVNNSFKLYRHCLTHLPWFFGSVLCCVCEHRFDSKPRLEDHCNSKEHKAAIEWVTSTLPDIQQLRIKYCELEGSSKGAVFQNFLQNYCLHKKTYTNFDRADGILDRNLFPLPPEQMDTPVQDDVTSDTGRYQGMLPTSIPLMSSQLSTVVGEGQINNLEIVGVEVHGQVDSHVESEPRSDAHPMPANGHLVQTVQNTSVSSLGDLPQPPKPAKRPRTQSTPGPQEDKLGQILTKLQSLEGKVDGLNKKVVETAEHQAAGIKNKLAKMTDLIESNTASIQDYSKTLATVLQSDLAKLFDTIRQINDNPACPKMSPAMMSALLTLSQEAVSMYGKPYQPEKVNQ